MFAIPNTLLVYAHASDHPRLEESQMARVRIAAKERDLAGRTASIRLRRTIAPLWGLDPRPCRLAPEASALDHSDKVSIEHHDRRPCLSCFKQLALSKKKLG